MRGKVCILFIVGLLISWKGWCQYTSTNSKFTVNEVKGCTGLNIQVTHNVLPACGSGGIFCVIDYGDGRPGQPFVNGDIANYPTAGNFKLKIIYSTTTVDNDSIPVSITANEPPAFEPYSCNGNQVSVKVTESNYAYYIFNYNDATAEVTKPANSATDIHTYATSSVRNVSVRGYNGPGTADNCVSNTLPVTVAAVLPAAKISQVEVLNTTDVKVDFASDPSIQYRLMIGTNNATSFQQYKTIYSPAAATLTETIPNIRPDDNFYCFRVDTYNPCGNNVAASSPIVCSTNFDVAAQNNQNNLTWNTATASGAHPLASFTVVKNSAALTPTLAASLRAYSDTDVVCGTSYTYRLESNYPGNVKSLSLPKTVTAFSTDIPAAIQNISAAVNPAGNSVQLSWVQDPAFNAAEYTILKSENGSYTPRSTTTQTNFTDDQYSTGSGSCYKIQYTDACNNKSLQSLEACPLALTGNVQGDNAINISWTPYTGWTGGVKNYFIEKYNANGELLQTIDAGSNTSYADNGQDLVNQVYRYIIYAYANDGTITQSVSNTLEMIKRPNIFYPTGFTPNNDGLNDTFTVFGQFVTKFEMGIFNRWGEMMYTTEDIDGAGWDGTYKGALMPEGTYVFKATITDLTGKTFERSGAIFLIHKK
ncbi:T9SS type B sorting domain-containing protein [Ohtaekwangia koreensis]|uniref:Gliding motility-associated C-terminal domain-containing protein n=1 Tax=Ohtaekwangia koreensis TaxID=688867 RepID=A0A1T5JLC1_9BACT|nr:T9SS type B sorting domain-containing protein [Ohtaekwangia koreensis]SKC52176.1 gliding motility-associated C-terminal domain-containing protein [Ohtaekwangia koreensis]